MVIVPAYFIDMPLKGFKLPPEPAHVHDVIPGMIVVDDDRQIVQPMLRGERRSLPRRSFQRFLIPDQAEHPRFGFPNF